jgi:F420-0:gamma-glutamyl ligase
MSVPDLPEVSAGADLAALIAHAVTRSAISIDRGDVFVVAQKIVSKAEARSWRWRTSSRRRSRASGLPNSGRTRRWSK